MDKSIINALPHIALGLNRGLCGHLTKTKHRDPNVFQVFVNLAVVING